MPAWRPPPGHGNGRPDPEERVGQRLGEPRCLNRENRRLPYGLG